MKYLFLFVEIGIIISTSFNLMDCCFALSIYKEDDVDKSGDGGVQEEMVVKNNKDEEEDQQEQDVVNMDGIGRECQSNEDCPKNHCCTVGMMRYTIPSCFPLGRIDDPCIPNNNPKNFTLSFPTYDSYHVMNSYIMFCPCDSKYICDKSSVTCQIQIDNSIIDGNELLK